MSSGRRWAALLLFVLFAGHPVAALVCEVECNGTPSTSARGPASEAPACHSATTAGDAPARLADARVGHCDHAGGPEALNPERCSRFLPRLEAAVPSCTPSALPSRRAQTVSPLDHNPPGPSIGRGIAIRV
jgi:hypothetical protein